MARLDERYNVPMYGRENFNDVWKEQQKLMEELEKKSKKATLKNPVGFLMRFPVADGYAIYRVSKSKPLTLQHVPVSDAYEIPPAHIRGITMAEVAQQIEWNKKWNSLPKGNK